MNYDATFNTDDSMLMNHGVMQLTEYDIKHRIVVIKINKRYRENMDSDAMYNTVRGIWRASIDRLRTVDYAFGVYNSVIVAVYKPTKWYICKNAKDMLPRKDIVLTPEDENRVFFVDENYEQGFPMDENQLFYYGKSIARFRTIQKAQNPITYLNPVNPDPYF